MPKVEPLGIKRIESLMYYVHDLERARRFLVDKLDFAELGESAPEIDREGRQHSAAFIAGSCLFVLNEPRGEGGRAWRFLRKHPEGVGTIVFEVEDIERAFRLLESRGGTMITDIQRFSDGGGTLAMFSITTPLGDTTFRFVERRGYLPLFPGFVAHTAPRGGSNSYELGGFDHVTSNFQTLAPAILWFEHVMGFERYWDVQFHTRDVATEDHRGSGLKSIVMWDPGSGVRFANNEPMRPFFKDSQINLFGDDHRGDGVQHAALTVRDIIGCTRSLRGKGVEFMPTPGAYYDFLPRHLERTKVGRIDEDPGVLRDLEILVDGEEPGKYLLQIFLKEAAALHDDPAAGPFFFELIQRKGSNGFGAGNFRSLFESIERAQIAAGRIS